MLCTFETELTSYSDPKKGHAIGLYKKKTNSVLVLSMDMKPSDLEDFASMIAANNDRQDLTTYTGKRCPCCDVGGRGVLTDRRLSDKELTTALRPLDRQVEACVLCNPELEALIFDMLLDQSDKRPAGRCSGLGGLVA